jgi:hypothetical protein
MYKINNVFDMIKTASQDQEGQARHLRWVGNAVYDYGYGL